MLIYPNSQYRVAKMNSYDWNDYHYLLNLGRYGSLSKAAKRMGISQSTMSRRINELETNTEAKLFKRHPTGFSLTKIGQEIFTRVEKIEEEVLNIQRKLSGQEEKLSGTIRISTSDTLGYYWLPRYIKKFKNLHPDINFDIIITSRYLNLTKREADIVIAPSNKHPDTMIGSILSPIEFRLYASLNYNNLNYLPTKLEELKEHKLILPNDYLRNLKINKLLRQYINEDNIMITSDKISGLYKYCKAGLGIAPLPTYVGNQDCELIEVFYPGEEYNQNIWLLTHPDLKNNSKIKSFMKFMKEEQLEMGFANYRLK